MRKFNPGKMWPPESNSYLEIETAWASFQRHELEIGAGVGRHPIEYGREHTNTLLVAVERTVDKFKKFKSRCAEKNVFPIHSDVVPWLWFFSENKQFDRIWILYPNPEPKNKNQRWVHQPFFNHIVDRLKPHGEIIMATNMQKYFEEAVHVLKNTWNLDVEGTVYLDSPRTHFENKYRLRGETCYNIIAKRK